MEHYFSRREFLKLLGATAGSASALGLLRPSLLFAQSCQNATAKINHTLILNMEGGVDTEWMFPLVGTAGSIMTARRPTIYVPTVNQVPQISPIGFNPAWDLLYKRFRDKKEGILIGGAGTANNSFSHDVAQTMLSTGDPNMNTPEGWLFTTCRSLGCNVNQFWGLNVLNQREFAGTHAGESIGFQIQNTLDSVDYSNLYGTWTRGANGTFEATLQRNLIQGIATPTAENPIEEQFREMVRRVPGFRDYVKAIAGRVVSGYKPTNDWTNYPDFAREAYIVNSFKDAQRIVENNQSLGVSSFVYIRLFGFDTHGEEVSTLQRKAKVLDDCINVFATNLTTSGIWAKTAIVSLGEFGRTLSENGMIGATGGGTGGGTDHGAARTVLVVGGSVNGADPTYGGFRGQVPDSTYLDARKSHSNQNESPFLNNYAPWVVDYRNIFAQILEGMGFDSHSVFQNYPRTELKLV